MKPTQMMLRYKGVDEIDADTNDADTIDADTNDRDAGQTVVHAS